MSRNVTTIAAKVPTTLAARLEHLARSRRLTLSMLLRAIAERELARDRNDSTGPIEATTRARLEQILDPEAPDARASVACELARRLDVDPRNGAQHSRELMRLLDDLEEEAWAADRPPTVLDELQARRTLRMAGYGVIAPDGRVLSEADPSAKSALLERRQWSAARRTRLATAATAEEE
jgi:hypothetical protein